MNRRAFLAGTAAGGALLGMPRVARAQSLGPQFQQQITIGVNVPLSGALRAAGSQIVDGVQAAVDQANNFEPQFSTAFAVRTFDDMDSLAQSIINVQFAASDSTLVALIAGPDGHLITSALTNYANAQMPLLAPASTADELTERGYRNVWRLPTKDATEGQLFARFILGRHKTKSALAVTQDGSYGADVARGFVDQAKALHTAAATFVFALDKPDYAAAARAVLAGKPEYIFLAGESRAMGPLVPALRSAGFAGSFGACEGFFNQATLDAYGNPLQDSLVSTSFPPLERAPDVANSLATFRAHYAVTAISAFAYAAAQLVIAATRRAGTVNRLTVLSALQSPAACATIAGSFQFAPTGDPIDPNLYFYSVRAGGFTYAGAAHPTVFVV